MSGEREMPDERELLLRFFSFLFFSFFLSKTQESPAFRCVKRIMKNGVSYNDAERLALTQAN